MLHAISISLAAALLLMPELVALIHFQLVSDYYQPQVGWAASAAVALTLLVAYLGLVGRPIVQRQHVGRRALALAGVLLALCLAIPWILGLGFAIAPWIVNILNRVHVGAYVGLFGACAVALAAKFLTLRVDALSDHINNRQLDELQAAIEQSFTGSAGQLDIAFAKADVDLTPYGGAASPLLLRSILEDANAQGRIADVLGAMRRANRADALLAELESRLLRTTEAADRPRLEGMVLKALQYRAAPQWVSELQAAFCSVCRVERASDGASMGTGFLVGPGLVLTNHHVMYPKGSAPVTVQFRFDALSDTDDGVVVHPNPASPVVASSPPGGTELGLVRDPGPDELDFVLVALDGSGSNLASRSPLAIDEGAGDAASAGHPILILEHPRGAPLQICIGSVMGMNRTATRLRHNATTQSGSSGSPCLSMELAVVALHNGGRGTSYNNAIPISQIVAALRTKGVAIQTTGHAERNAS